MRSVSVRLCDLQKAVIPIGFSGENMHTKVQIDCKRVFDDYPDAIVYMAVKPPQGDTYPAIVTRDGDIVTWEVTNSDLLYPGSGEFQLEFTVDDVIVKSFVGKLRIEKSIIVTGEVPDPWTSWIYAIEQAAGIAILQNGMIKFEINDEGHLILSYTDDVPIERT